MLGLIELPVVLLILAGPLQVESAPIEKSSLASLASRNERSCSTFKEVQSIAAGVSIEVQSSLLSVL